MQRIRLLPPLDRLPPCPLHHPFQSDCSISPTLCSSGPLCMQQGIRPLPALDFLAPCPSHHPFHTDSLRGSTLCSSEPLAVLVPAPRADVCGSSLVRISPLALVFRPADLRG